MAERSVRVRLTAVIDDFRRQMGEAAKATGQVGDAAEDAGKKSGRLGDAARGVGKVALTGLGIATAATAALGTAALKTGISYNALEQTSRAALTTLLGSSEAAADQMERLREFVRTSPFPREVWIEAQQTLLAFGLEASRVIPTLDAIQDAAAAAGLSTHEIGGLVEIFARIQSSGRITGQELRQFAIRGIDAAGLLGQAYGKTADQIRQDITSGAIDGRQALTDLTAQMTETFGGAAANVQQTWMGATDSLRGAFRDVGSIIASPFVDPEGGGAAVDWARSLADALRALEGLLGPVVTALASRAGPAFQSFTDTLERAAEAMRNADPDRVTEQLGRLTPAIAGLGAAGAAASTRMIPFVRGFGPQGAMVAGLAGFVLSVPEARRALIDLLDALRPVAESAGRLAAALVPVLTDALIRVVETAEPAIRVLDLIAGGVELAADAIDDLEQKKEQEGFFGWYAERIGQAAGALGDIVNTMFPVKAGLDLVGSAFGLVGDESDGAQWSVEQYNRSTNEAGRQSKESASEVDEFGNAIDDVATAAEEADEALSDYLDTIRGAVDPVVAMFNAVRDVEKAQKDYNEAVKEHGPKSKEAQDAAFALTQKLVGAEAAALAADLSFEEFEGQLDEWVRQGRITKDQADILRRGVKDLREEAEDWEGDYVGDIKTTGVPKTLAEIRSIKRLIDSLPGRKDITIAAITGSHTPTFGITRAAGGPVDGPGSPTVDSIPAMLAPGEFVMKAAARRKYGDKLMAAINAGLADVAFGGGKLTDVQVKHETKLDGTDFINAAGRVAAAMGRAAGLGSGRVLPRGSYRIGRGSRAHGYGALDLPAPTGTPVYAVAPGVISRAMRLAGSYGIHAFVNHPGNRQSRYAHLSSLAVRAGMAVRGGALLGRVGSTGNSTGPHLHYEDLINGVRRMPERLGIFDGGGMMKPGQGGVNTSSKPEPVLTDRQWATMHSLATSGGAARPAQVHITIGGDGALAETFKASHRKGEVRITVDGRPAQVS